MEIVQNREVYSQPHRGADTFDSEGANASLVRRLPSNHSRAAECPWDEPSLVLVEGTTACVVGLSYIEDTPPFASFDYIV